MTTSIPTPTQKFPRKFNTLQILRAGWYTTWGISFLLAIASIYSVNSQRQALKTVGKESVPSILIAQRLRDSFADIDASLANELLLKPGQNQQALADFEKNRAKIADRLLGASKNITYPGEEKIVGNLQLNTLEYFLKIQEVRDAHKLGNNAVNTLNLYREAAKIIDEKILPEATKLDKVNFDELAASYDRINNWNGARNLLIALLALSQISILVTIQIFLYRRTNRVLNVRLLGATAIATIFFGYTMFSLVSASRNLKVAKEDAFDSLHALRQMRALSYKANGDESRYLLDPANSAKHEQAFNQNIQTIINIPPTLSFTKIINNTSQGAKSEGLSGLFADELNNITFDREREFAVATLKAFSEYLTIDKQIRELYRSGKVAEAIDLCISNQPGKSNWAFDRYKTVHGKLMDVNDKEFARHIEFGEQNLAYFEYIAVFALGGVAILTLFGLRPRLTEYL
jgi:hypothetical protein